MKKNLEVIQEEISDCGVCSLLSIIRYYGGNENLESLRMDSYTTKEGVNAYNLICCARKYGLDAKGVNVKSLNNLTLPVIAHIKINNSLSHFIVIYKIYDDYIYVMDPAYGFKKMSIDEFYEKTTNVYIILEPKQKLNYKVIDKTAEKKFIKVLKQNKNSLLILLFLNVLFIIFTLLSSLYVKVFDNIEYIFYFTIIFLIVNVIMYYLSFTINKYSFKITNKINKELLSNFLNHIFNLPLKYIHMKDKNEIIKRTDEIEAINNIMCDTLISLILNLMVLISIVVLEFVLFIYSLTPIILLLIFYSFITILTLKKIKSLINETINTSTEYKSTLIEHVNNINSINHSSSNSLYLNILIGKLNKYLDRETSNSQYLNKINTLKSFISSVFVLVSNLLLIYYINMKNYDISLLIIINYLNTFLQSSIVEICNLLPNFYYYKSISNKLNEFYNIEEDEKGKICLNNFNINIKNVSFSYNKFNNLFNNINIDIKYGDKIILRGKSGCGKSTLLKILCKEIKDYDGSIYFGNINLKNIPKETINKYIYYSSQNENIFMDTIKNNITMYHGYDEDLLNKVIEVTELNTILNKKSFGIDSFLYGGGEELSGGEKELIILARCLMSDAKILFLDESLSQVNEDLEYRIIRNIISVFNNKTIIYISHKENINYPMKEIHIERKEK